MDLESPQGYLNISKVSMHHERYMDITCKHNAIDAIVFGTMQDNGKATTFWLMTLIFKN